MKLNCSILIILFIFLLSCNSSPKNQQKSILGSTDDITSFWEINNKGKDKVLIICDGGPKWKMDFKQKGKTAYRYLNTYKDYEIAYVHQAQTLDSRIFDMSRNLTLKEAKQETQKSTVMLKMSIDYFKKHKKEVIVIGKSYGAYIIQDYLSKYPSNADKYFINAGRLDVNKEMTQQQLKGFSGRFAKDGLTYLPEDENADNSDYTQQENINYQKKQLLKVAYGINNYIEKLKNINLDNVVYFYGTVDENIGSLTTKELRFLKSKNVKVHSFETDHSGMTYKFIDYINDNGF
jgi:hypothetical protein